MKKKYLGLRQQLLLLSLCSGSLMASPCQAGPTIPGFIGNSADVLPSIPATALPTGGTIIQGIDSIRELSTSQMEITQNQPKAVIRWQRFDIGSQASVNFNQQGNASWSALNSIGSTSPSQIHGKLTADGNVYLINQNGIFFGPTAQVNVHSLTASSLNLDENHFNQGYSTTTGTVTTLTFRNGDGSPGGSVENSGAITAADGGQVFLIGGKAVNSGSITANQGFVALAAGDSVSLQYANVISRYAFPTVQTSGSTAEVVNTSIDSSPGLLRADEGIVGLYGGIVNQNGRAIATTALSRNGQIELKGLSRVSTGAGSLTATPVTASTERQTPPENQNEIKRGLITVNSKEFIHQGAIVSPGGVVQATGLTVSSPLETIRLETGSSIDVSGLWVDQTVEDRILRVQLNSDALKDAYALKYGPLFGEWVRVDLLNGMPAADISAYIDNRPRSAAELLTEGGTIELTADRVEIMPGSHMDIGGGGLNFSAGELDLTMVRVGSRLLTLSELPFGVPVDEVLGSFTRNHSRYGVRENWNGLYYGGIHPLSLNSPAFFQGSNAGKLTISTPYLFMAGSLDGWVERGFYQTEEKDRTYANGKTLAIGRSMPRGGTLEIGSSTSSMTLVGAAQSSAPTHAIAVVAAMEGAPAKIGSTTAVSTISSSILNNAGLSSLGLNANTTFSLAEDATIRLTPGGSFNASARKIDIAGDILAPGGSISIVSTSNKTSFDFVNGMDTGEQYIPLEESLTIHSGAVLDVGGEQINNYGRHQIAYGYTRGGTITLTNEGAPSDNEFRTPSHGYNLTVAAGARLSVQGGYWQDVMGKITGADAGSLVISQKITENPETQELPDQLRFVLDGELEGHAMLGNQGGSLTIGTVGMTIFPGAGGTPPPKSMDTPWAGIVLADNRFARTGFSSITLRTYGDLTVTGGSHLEPSALRRTPFTSYYEGGLPPGLINTSTPFVTALPLETGATRVELTAGTDKHTSENHSPKLTLEEGAIISVTPNGKGAISLSTFGSVNIDGILEAKAGSIAITGQDITVGRTARILAPGVNLEQPADTGLRAATNWKTLNGGTVTLSATRGTGGSLFLDYGSLIDVSGSPRVSNPFTDDLGNFFLRDVAGRPGSVYLDFTDDLSINGALSSESYLFGLTGGTLSVKRSHGTEALLVTEALVRSMEQPGFDDLRLASTVGINFAESIALVSDRRLVLDAPQLISQGGSASLYAPWVQIVNQQRDYLRTSFDPALADGSPTLSAHASHIDIEGNIRTNGFSLVSLQAERDIRLSEWLYTGEMPLALKHSGAFTLSGDLTLQANAIYPTTESRYTITANSGQVTILPSPNKSAGPVYSAGGSLTINARDIDHAGALFAPMGNLTLTADQGRVLLAPGSLVSVSGVGNLPYGFITQGAWKLLDKASGQYVDMTPPNPTISISGKEVLVAEGSQMEAGGGGSLSAHEFVAGFDGTSNPLLVKERMVILPDGSLTMPELGEIYLKGYAPLGLAEGVYSILPAKYAFLPGALVLEPGPTGIFSGPGSVNLLQQPIIAGYERAYGSNEVPLTMNGYVIRTAADVMKEGKFDYRNLQIENGGNISIGGDTLVVLGRVSAMGVGSGHGGNMTLAGTSINYGVVPTELRGMSSLADMNRLKDEKYANQTWIDTSLFADSGALSKLILGNAATKAVTFASDQTLQGVPHIVIKAKDSITINENVAIRALATSNDEGILELSTASLTTRAGSLLHASDELNLNITGRWDLSGDWLVDDGRVHLSSTLFSLGSDTGKDPGVGLFMTQAMVNAFARVKELWIDSATDIRFVDNLAIDTSGSIVLNSQRLLFDESAGSPAPAGRTVSINASALRLQNSRGPSAETEVTATNDHNLQLDAQKLILGPGSVRVDGFTDVTFNTAGPLFFEGQGELKAQLPGTGALTMTAAGFFSAFPQDMENFSANRFVISSDLGEIFFRGSGGDVSNVMATPGSLSVTGRSITLDGAVFDLPGGRLEFAATGTGENDRALLKNGTRILARGGILQQSLGLSDPNAAVRFHLPGGEVLLSADSGRVEFEGAMNTIDVSASDNQNGGRVRIDGGNSDLDLNALRLLGGGGAGGSFELVTRALPQLDGLATTLANGGFINKLNIRARQDDMVLNSGYTLAARSITLAADGENDPSGEKGSIVIAGTISASGETGGAIAIYAEQDLTLAAKGRIEARGITGSGGEVLLSSELGTVRTDLHSMIDTTGQGTDTRKNGTVTFRTGLTETQAGGATTYDVRLDARGTVNSGETILQPVKTYTYAPGTSITGNELGNIALADLSANNEGTWIGDSHRFIDGLASYKTAGYTLRPEIEVRSSGDLTLASGFQTVGNVGTNYLQHDLASWRPDGQPGILTFRAGGNLNVHTSISDVPTRPMVNAITGEIPLNNNEYVRDIQPDGLVDAWALSFIAGADLTASNPLVADAKRDLTIGRNDTAVSVYSESGDINLIAGQDIKVYPMRSSTAPLFLSYVPGIKTFTVGTFDGDIQVQAGRDLDLTATYRFGLNSFGSSLQNGIGDIHIETGGNVLLGDFGSIRTTGRMPTWDESGANYQAYYNAAVTTFNNSKTTTNKTALNLADFRRSQLFWLYRDGGDIFIQAGGNVTGTVKIGLNKTNLGWDNVFQDFGSTPLLTNNTQRWSANYINTTTYPGIVAMGGGSIDVESGGNFLAHAGAFGQNDVAALSIHAKGDLDGQFLAMRGDSLLSTLGGFGTAAIGTKDSTTGVGIGDVRLAIQSMGDTEVVTIYNPTLGNAHVSAATSATNKAVSYLSYSAESMASISSLYGSVLFAGTDTVTTSTNLKLYTVLPGSLSIHAARDILFTNNFSVPFIMAPSPEGNLELLAGQDIQGLMTTSASTSNFSILRMSDAPMSSYEVITTRPAGLISGLERSISNPPLHKGDWNPAHIQAGRDIFNIDFRLPKMAEIIAGRDLLNILYIGQHLRADDQSVLSAGRDFRQPNIVSDSRPTTANPGVFYGITQAGPGSLLVHAGNDLDLANSSGIRSIGSSANPAAQDTTIAPDVNGRIKGSDITVIVGYDARPSASETAEFLTALKAAIRDVSTLIAEGKESEAAVLKERIRAELFTPFLYNHLSGTGDLNMTTSSIHTVSGQDTINIFAAGDVNVGVTRIEETTTTVQFPKDTGIFTAGGGPINLLAGGDVNVNESRVMTLLGGDLIVLSDTGNINAGRGSKAKVTAAEPQVVEQDGIKSVIFSPPAVGSGLRTVSYDPDGTGPKVTPEPGDMYVVAWDGVVDAGEAGIEGGRLFLAANQVLNAQNISVGAGSVGVPAASGAPASLGALTGDSMSATQSATADIAKTASTADNMADTAKKIADTISQLRLFVVKFLGFME